MISAPLNPRAAREASLPFDPRLVRPLRVGDARILGRIALYLVPIVGVAIVLGAWLARHVGLLADHRAPAPSSEPWIGLFVLAAAVWGAIALAASVLNGVRG
jgi:hypothetical protein